MNIDIFYAIIAFIASCLFGIITIPLVLDFCKHKGLYDIPNQRKVHKNAVPRLGGVVFLPCVFLGCMGAFVLAYYNGATTMTLSLWTVNFIMGIAAIYITGLVDDIIGLSALPKLIVQLIAASVLPLSGLYLNTLYGFCGIYDIPYYIGMPLTVVIVAFISNAINLIDGIDGLAGGLAVLALAGFLYAFCQWGLYTYAIIIAALMGVIVSYLFFNIFGNPEKNRKIFMGDTGSLSIGFLLAFLSLKLCMYNPLVMPYNGNSLILSLTLLIVPTFDVFRVSMVRLRHHRSPVAPDKNHIHHKLMRAGLSQHQTLIAILGLAIGFCILNYLLSRIAGSTFIILTDIVVYSLFHIALNGKIKEKGLDPDIFE